MRHYWFFSKYYYYYYYWKRNRHFLFIAINIHRRNDWKKKPRKWNLCNRRRKPLWEGQSTRVKHRTKGGLIKIKQATRYFTTVSSTVEPPVSDHPKCKGLVVNYGSRTAKARFIIQPRIKCYIYSIIMIFPANYW